MKNIDRNLMFSFVSQYRPNPLGGDCYGCIYCYIHSEKCGMKRWLPKLKKKYNGEFKLYPLVLKQIREMKSLKDVFFCDAIDYLHKDNPVENIYEIWEAIEYNHNVQFISLTKNPKRYNELIDSIPKNMIIGFTCESDVNYPDVSKDAPLQNDRILEMFEVVNQLEYYNMNNKIFWSIEPILKFNYYRFVDYIKELNPSYGCAMGYDNHKNKLPEPSLSDTEFLRNTLIEFGIRVFDKTYRKAWWEK